ncbi:PIN domain protein [compost metagenome]
MALPEAARKLILSPDTEPLFSAASIWEIAIKRAKGSSDFQFDPSVVRAALLRSGYVELPIGSPAGIFAGSLPPHHKDPFDRILIGQAIEHGCTLVTHDGHMAKYATVAPIKMV